MSPRTVVCSLAGGRRGRGQAVVSTGRRSGGTASGTAGPRAARQPSAGLGPPSRITSPTAGFTALRHLRPACISH
jgi:hypothetical protein